MRKHAAAIPPLGLYPWLLLSLPFAELFPLSLSPIPPSFFSAHSPPYYSTLRFSNYPLVSRDIEVGMRCEGGVFIDCSRQVGLACSRHSTEDSGPTPHPFHRIVRILPNLQTPSPHLPTPSPLQLLPPPCTTHTMKI
ncbi:hypothetical protein CDAR_498781 [Caerostris darwini]|uniref:Uncharacterized protein n=1 Tax=Caerostris darwini TaxID=1538125 RepID=A0AAV4SJ79_9ARAC|nr:hypothetical protein CDAR_498781 [Caerostris darwini]